MRLAKFTLANQFQNAPHTPIPINENDHPINKKYWTGPHSRYAPLPSGILSVPPLDSMEMPYALVAMVQVVDLSVELIGVESMTSSMPFRQRSNRGLRSAVPLRPSISSEVLIERELNPSRRRSAVIGKSSEWRCSLLCLQELTYQRHNLICFGIEREVSCVEYVDLCVGYVLAVAFWFADIKREIVLAPED
jgi:hypothetical protein